MEEEVRPSKQRWSLDSAINLIVCNTGICACFVKRAADLGAKVVNADLKMTSEGEKLLSGLDNVHFQKTDASKWDQLQNLVTVAKDKFGSTPDVFIGGAGVFEPPVCKLIVIRRDAINTYMGWWWVMLTQNRKYPAFGTILNKTTDTAQ